MWAAHLVVPPDLTHEAAERLVDVDSLLGGRLDELAAKVLREVAALCVARSAGGRRGAGACARTVHAHLALVLQVALVRNNDDGERVLVLHAQDLLVEGADFLE